MAGPSDKARFYLEQSATELNELERKQIFTRVGMPLSKLDIELLTRCTARNPLNSTDTLQV
jgi:hypothetical protein